MYLPLRLLTWRFCGIVSHLVYRAAPCSEKIVSRTVRVFVSSKDVHVWAMAGRQTVAVVHLRKERLRKFTLVVTQLPRITIQRTTWLLNGSVKTWKSKKILMRLGLKHLGSGHYGDGIPVHVLLRNGSGERFLHTKDSNANAVVQNTASGLQAGNFICVFLVRSPHKQRRRRAQTQPSRAHRFGTQCVGH